MLKRRTDGTAAAVAMAGRPARPGPNASPQLRGGSVPTGPGPMRGPGHDPWRCVKLLLSRDECLLINIKGSARVCIVTAVCLFVCLFVFFSRPLESIKRY